MSASFIQGAFTGLLLRRSFARWTHRQPAKIYSPALKDDLQEDIITLKPEELESEVINEVKRHKKIENVLKPLGTTAIPSSLTNLEIPKSISEPAKKIDFKEIKKKKVALNLEKQKKLKNISVFDENGEIIYEKLQENDSKVSITLTELKSKKQRALYGRVGVEGWRMITSGLQAGCSLQCVIFSRKDELNMLKPVLPKKGVKIYKIPYKEIKLWSDLETSPGIIGVFKTPEVKELKKPSHSLPMNIVCDNIREPGNLGAILRVAIGAGCQNVILMKGCVDLWDSKVVRSAAGAHFTMPIHSGITWDEITPLLSPDNTIFIADNNKIHLKQKFSTTQEQSNNDTRTLKSNEQSDIATASSNGTEELSISDIDIPVLPYYGYDYCNTSAITLIIGGETEGISEDSYRFCAKMNGLRLNIPLYPGLESLNSAIAAAIIAFEIKKQFLQKKAQANIESVT